MKPEPSAKVKFLKIDDIRELPRVPSVYTLMGGYGAIRYVAYIGIAGKLKERIRQHLVRRDSSVTTGTTAASLNPDYITEVWWWEAEELNDKDTRCAAEILAIEVLDPALRSRGTPPAGALKKIQDPAFAKCFRTLFEGEPTGRLVLPTLANALERIRALEQRLRELEAGT